MAKNEYFPKNSTHSLTHHSDNYSASQSGLQRSYLDRGRSLASFSLFALQK